MNVSDEKSGRYNIESGEDKAWRELAADNTSDVCRRSLASWDDAARAYTLEILGEKYSIFPATRKIVNLDNPGRKFEYFLNLSAPIYLVRARDAAPSGELVKELKGGEFFFRGSHTLPLDAVAQKYGRDRGLFEDAGRSMKGEPLKMGDAAFRFYPFPRVAMAFVIWFEDDEFEARVSLLFDRDADKHMALDVVWAMALLSCQRMLGFAR
ncbi:MAG TPA: DUF3786 domain-containing protein [Nitrospirota bacterium]